MDVRSASRAGDTTSPSSASCGCQPVPTAATVPPAPAREMSCAASSDGRAMTVKADVTTHRTMQFLGSMIVTLLLHAWGGSRQALSLYPCIGERRHMTPDFGLRTAHQERPRGSLVRSTKYEVRSPRWCLPLQIYASPHIYTSVCQGKSP